MMTLEWPYLFYRMVKFGNLSFDIGKSKTVDFSETFAAWKLEGADI